MAHGPRDWNPPGYWDDRPPPRRSGTTTGTSRTGVGSGLAGFLAVALGLVSCWLPLSIAGESLGGRGWVVTTIGLTAVGFAVAAARARANQSRTAGLPAVLGGTLGVAGTILCLWSVAAFYAPTTIPSVPQLSTLINHGVTAPMVGTPPSIGSLTPSAPAVRVVAPIAGAEVTSPSGQLRANVLHVAFGLCVGISSTAQMRAQYGDAVTAVPLSLAVAPDGTVTGGGATFSKVPADMTLEYSATPAGAFSLTVRDTASGVGVGCDSTSNKLIDR